MAKTRTPVLSLGAHGTLGDALTFQKRGRDTIVRAKPTPLQPQTQTQLDHWLFYRGVCFLWQSLSAAEKATYLSDARQFRITGFNLFMREELSRLLHPNVLLPFAKGSGATLFDYSGNESNASITGATWRQGAFKPYLYFDGLNDKAVFAGTFADLFFTNIGNLEVKITPIVTGVHNLVNDYDFVPNSGMALRINANRTVQFMGRNVVFVFNIVTTYTLSDGVTYVIRAELTGSLARIYIDEVLRASGAQTGVIASSGHNLGIGYYPHGNSLWFKGDYHYLVSYP